MTAFTINLVMIGLIMISILFLYLVVHRVRRWWIWLIPLFMYILHGLIYSLVYISDYHDGIQNVILYNYWNNVLRGQSYLTVIMYAAAFLLLQRKVNKDG